MLPAVNLKPPFNITRFSHVVLEVDDVERSRDFYVDVGGLVETEFADGVSYLRGLSEACHHSLVLAPAGGKPTCRRIGYRVFLEEDLRGPGEWLLPALMALAVALLAWAAWGLAVEYWES